MARLGDICRFQSGGTPAKGEPSYFSGDIPWITTVALNRSIIGEESAVDWITEKAIRESAAKIVPANSIMVGTRVGVGKVAINSTPMSTSQDIISLLDIDESKWSKAFVCKFILAKGTYLNSQARGATIKGIKIETLADLQLPDVSLEEQCKIAHTIDRVSELIALRKEQLAALDQLVKSRFVELFIGKGYPVTSIKELLVQNSTVEKISNTKIEKFVTVGIKGKGAREREIKDGKWPVPFSGYRVKEGQFIYSRIDARNGAFAILPKEVDGAVVSKDFPVFEIKADKMLPNVLLFSVLQDDFVRQIQNSSFGATNRQRIQEEVFGAYRITLPPMEIQNQFTAFVEQTDKAKLAIQRSLDELETLKKALMQKYFE